MIFSDLITPELKRIKKEFAILDNLHIKIGIQGDEDSTLLMIAHIHEFGATITAKNAKNLAIPIHKDSYGKSPRDFNNLSYVPSEDNTHGWLVRKKTLKRMHKESSKNYDWLFLLVHRVTIPERSFIRAGYDHNVKRLEEEVKKTVTNIIHEGWGGKQAAEYIGGKAVDFIKEYINTASNFRPKGDIQQKAAPSWSGSPLVVTGRLRNSITFIVEEKA